MLGDPLRAGGLERLLTPNFMFATGFEKYSCPHFYSKKKKALAYENGCCTETKGDKMPACRHKQNMNILPLQGTTEKPLKRRKGH